MEPPFCERGSVLFGQPAGLVLHGAQRLELLRRVPAEAAVGQHRARETGLGLLPLGLLSAAGPSPPVVLVEAAALLLAPPLPGLRLSAALRLEPAALAGLGLGRGTLLREPGLLPLPLALALRRRLLLLPAPLGLLLLPLALLLLLLRLPALLGLLGLPPGVRVEALPLLAEELAAVRLLLLQAPP